MSNEHTTKFTKSEFLTQISHFRTLMGDKSFMESPEEKREVATNALMYAYSRVEGSQQDLDTCTFLLKATIAEYGQRLAFITVRPLRQALGLTR